MNIKDLESNLTLIKNKPKSTLLILIILLLMTIVGTTLTSFFEETGKKLANPKNDNQEKYNLIFSRITLSNKNKYWKKVPRNTPNYYDEKRVDLDESGVPKRNCPDVFLSEMWCKETELFFAQIGLQNEAIDPSLDIVIENKSKTPVTFLAVGVEIVAAFHSTYSFGDWESTRVVIEGEYDIEMPSSPKKVKLDNGDIVDVEKERTQAEKDSGMSLTDLSIRALLGVTYWEWDGLPITAEKELQDPIYMQPNTPYRFILVLKEYKNMPNNVVLRLWIKTSEGVQKSEYVYLLAI